MVAEQLGGRVRDFPLGERGESRPASDVAKVPRVRHLGTPVGEGDRVLALREVGARSEILEAPVGAVGHEAALVDDEVKLG